MSKTSIGWTDWTWNPTRGCTAVSPGCLNCYAGTMASRFSDPGYWGHGFAERNGKPGGGRWTGKVALVPNKLAEPLSWRKPRTCFVNSTSDLFHESLSFEEIAAVIGIIAASPRHTFQVLTKRAPRMREWFEWIAGAGARCDYPADSVSVWARTALRGNGIAGSRFRKATYKVMPSWPLPNLWIGVSAEDQKRWDERVWQLEDCPAPVRFVSAEPLLSRVDIGCPQVDQVIVGAESGPGARPMQTEWAASIRDQCKDAGVAFYMKQFSTPKGRKITDPTKWPGVKVPCYLSRECHAEARLRFAQETWPQEFPH